ncbi:MAG: YggT family protein, partial [Gammaproteobacteria bacterium]|nr:YggT family protein [Gammaproteobacteria bacterium]
LALLVIAGTRAGAGALTVMSLLRLCTLSLNLFFFAILIRIILSWVAPHAYNPISAMAGSLADPVLRPFRRIIPPIGGLDVSPIFAIVILKAVEIFLQSLRPIPF